MLILSSTLFYEKYIFIKNLKIKCLSFKENFPV